MRVIEVGRFGGPEVLELVEVPVPRPGPGELRVAVEAIGVAWLDTRIREGDAPPDFAPELPFVPGSAVAGTVDAVGPGVTGVEPGARVLARPVGGVYGGGYAEAVISTPAQTFAVPEGVDLRDALAVLDDGSTALGLLERTPVGDGDRVLVVPGLGGLGSLLVQLAAAAGATVLAAVRGPDKVAAAAARGVEAVDYSSADWPEQVRRLTGGRGLDVVFDGVGGSLGATLLGLLVDGGRFSGYGMSSGAETAIPAADAARLTTVGMDQLPELWPDAPRRVEQAIEEVRAGRLRPLIGQTYAFTDAAAAHADIEARRIVGKSLLLTRP
jgi:NADPH2:quinone reductase